MLPSRRAGNGEGGTKALILRGPGGSGKSSLMLHIVLQEVQNISLFGHAKFDPGDPTPYSAIVSIIPYFHANLLKVLVTAVMFIHHIPPVPDTSYTRNICVWGDAARTSWSADVGECLCLYLWMRFICNHGTEYLIAVHSRPGA
jgi:hypothetical protein